MVKRMVSVLLKLTLILVAVGSALVSAVHQPQGEDVGLRRLLLPAPGCASGCWNGIEIGVTTREEATRILETSPWVAEVFQTPLTVTWRWNGEQPPEINGERDGLMQIGNNRVRQIRIQTLIPFGDVWLLLDRPDNTQLVMTLTRSSAYQIASYDEGIRAISTIGCSVTPTVFWSTPITLGIGDIWSTEALNGRGFDIYQSASWWHRLRFC
jgi:hypothetical protein